MGVGERKLSNDRCEMAQSYTENWNTYSLETHDIKRQPTHLLDQHMQNIYTWVETKLNNAQMCFFQTRWELMAIILSLHSSFLLIIIASCSTNCCFPSLPPTNFSAKIAWLFWYSRSILQNERKNLWYFAHCTKFFNKSFKIKHLPIKSMHFHNFVCSFWRDGL